MARYGQEHKDATRRRIIGAAGRRFKRDGIDGSGIAALMADADLTNGAFYAHFRSKDDLIASVIEEELRLQAAWVDALAPGRAGVEQLVRAYLSPEHRDHPDAGCPSAALLDEIGRSDVLTQTAYHRRRPDARGADRRASHTRGPGGGTRTRPEPVHDDHRHPAAVPGRRRS